MTHTIHFSTVSFGLLWFVLWTLFSFLAHYFARASIQSTGTVSKSQEWITVLLVTIVQLAVGTVVMQIVLSLIDRGPLSMWNEAIQKNEQAVPGEHDTPCKTSMYLSHAFATLATNASIAFVNTGSAFTIKAFEPVSTAVLTSMLLGLKLQTHVIIALPLVVSGALGFVWQPSLQHGATLGLGMAFVSNVLFGIRNINLKLMQRDACSTRAKLALIQSASITAAAVLTVVTVILVIMTSRPASFNLVDSLVSGLFHVTYTIISTSIILKYTSVVGHATINLLKRILIAVIFYLIGHTAVTTSNWLMGAIMVLGLIIYVFPKICPFINDSNSSLSLLAIMVILVLVVSLTHSSTSNSREYRVPNEPRVQLPTLDLQMSLNSRQHSLAQSLSSDGSLQGLGLAKSYEEPKKANLQSIKAKDTNSLIKEAYRLHEEIFTHIIGKYRRAVLVNVFQWFNKGDHLITIGQRRILHRMGIELIYHCFYPGKNCNFANIDKTDPELVILIQGAGYIGHPSHEFVTTTTVDNFPNNRIMVFPISVCHPIAPCTEIQQFADIFKKHKDVHIVLRDRYSYDLAEQYFSNTHNYLGPDSAFAVGSIRMNIIPVYDIVWLKRDDWESQNDPMPTLPPNLKIQVTDWSDEWMNQKSDDFWEDHQLRTMTGISFLARAKVVVSDRLHAHIMSQLMGKLNVVINSATKKQEHYYMTWEQSVNTSVLVNNNADALVEAVKLLKHYDKSVTLA